MGVFGFEPQQNHDTVAIVDDAIGQLCGQAHQMVGSVNPGEVWAGLGVVQVLAKHEFRMVADLVNDAIMACVRLEGDDRWWAEWQGERNAPEKARKACKRLRRMLESLRRNGFVRAPGAASTPAGTPT